MVRRFGGLLLLAALILTAFAQADDALSPDALIAAGQKAYQEKEYGTAIGAFRDFLKQYPKHAQANTVRHHLAVCLLDSPNPDFAGARDLLQPLAAVESPARPAILFGLATAQRGLGLQAFLKDGKLATAKPAFEEAARQFAAAGQAFRQRTKTAPVDGPVPADLEWAGQASALQAEMLLRLGQPKEAAAVLAPLVKEPWLARARCGNRVLYYQGYTETLLGDRLAAGRAFGRLRPFTDPAFGSPAAYFLGRLHHQDEERAEATIHYQMVVSAFETLRTVAAEAQQDTAKLPADPEDRARIEAALKEAPDHVGRAVFFLAAIEYEAGRAANAHQRVVDFAQRYPRTPLVAEARLLQGACEVQLGRAADAVATLQPLTGTGSRLRGPALFWLGKAQLGAADTDDPDAAATALERATTTLRQALEIYAGPAPQAETAEHQARRGEILLALADVHERAGQFARAASLLGQLLDERLTPIPGDELLQRQITALNLAKDYAASEKLVTHFIQAYPRSLVIPEVHFRHAENCFFQSNKEAAKAYQLVVDRFPESPQVNAAHYGLGWLHYQAAAYDKAREQFEAIAAADRMGDLSNTSFLLADCLMRLAPEQADDAITIARLQESLRGAADLLAGLATEQPEGSLTPEALLRLGVCQRRLAESLEGEDRNQALAAARSAFERVLIEHPGSEHGALAGVERARCLVRQGGPEEAVAALASFNGPALRRNPIAPLAILQRAILLRGMENKAPIAVRELTALRREQEKALLKEPASAGLVTLLRQQHALALKDAGKFGEARTLLDLLRKEAGDRPEGWDAAIRWGQCLAADGAQTIDRTNQALAPPDLAPRDRQALEKQLEAGRGLVREAAHHFEALADKWKATPAAAAMRARALYEAAWLYRGWAGDEVESAWNEMRDRLQKEEQEKAAKQTPKGQEVPQVAAPDVPRSRVAVQPSEKRMRELYRELTTAYADVPLGQAAFLELAETLAEREDCAAAIPLLKQALDKEPPPEMTAKLRLRLGAIYLAQNDVKSAQGQFAVAAADPNGPLSAHASYRLGECLMQQQKWSDAVKQLLPFRDQEPLQNIGGVSDPALLRLGHAYAQLKDWTQAKETQKALVARFGGSPWVAEAAYGIGQARQNLKNYDGATEAYNQAIGVGPSEAAARSQLGIGLCLIDGKNFADAIPALETVANNYPYPDLGALALLEAADAASRLKKADDTNRLLRLLLEKYPKSAFAEKASKCLKAPKELTTPPHETPAAIVVLTPSLPSSLPLEPLGQQVSDDDRQDPLDGLMREMILARRPPARLGPASTVRSEVEDPFAHRLPFALPSAIPEDALPLLLHVPVPRE
jgi:TolA-binding protein